MKVVYCATVGLKIGGFKEWPLTENRDLSELPTREKRGFYKKDDLFELHRSKKWSL